jgi:hypothetical protein
MWVLFSGQNYRVTDTNPYVFGPPGSESFSQIFGSGSFCNQAKIVRKTLIPTVLFCYFLDFLSLKNDLNVASKSNKQEKFLKKVFCWRLEGQ